MKSFRRPNSHHLQTAINGRAISRGVSRRGLPIRTVANRQNALTVSRRFRCIAPSALD
jgi:hypothetical protein